MKDKSAAPPTTAAPVLDFMGREIKANDTVVYPVRRGSSMWMAEMKVTQVVAGEAPSLSGFNTAGRKITIHNLGNVTVVEPRAVPKV